MWLNHFLIRMCLGVYLCVGVGLGVLTWYQIRGYLSSHTPKFEDIFCVKNSLRISSDYFACKCSKVERCMQKIFLGVVPKLAQIWGYFCVRLVVVYCPHISISSDWGCDFSEMTEFLQQLEDILKLWNVWVHEQLEDILRFHKIYSKACVTEFSHIRLSNGSS